MTLIKISYGLDTKDAIGCEHEEKKKKSLPLAHAALCSLLTASASNSCPRNNRAEKYNSMTPTRGDFSPATFIKKSKIKDHWTALLSIN